MENVAYLEIDDFDSDGNLKQYVCRGKNVVIMGQATFCGYCKQAGPAFEKFAKSHPNVVAATIVGCGVPFCVNDDDGICTAVYCSIVGYYCFVAMHWNGKLQVAMKQ